MRLSVYVSDKDPLHLMRLEGKPEGTAAAATQGIGAANLCSMTSSLEAQ